MATFKKRNGRYQAQIRRKGYPPTYKTFSSITAAKKWVQVTEADMERRTYAPALSVSVCEILERYEREVLPFHKGHQAERYRVQTLLGFFGGLKLVHLTSQGSGQIQGHETETSLPRFFEERTHNIQSGTGDCFQRLGHCPTPESYQDDLLTQGRQATD